MVATQSLSAAASTLVQVWPSQSGLLASTAAGLWGVGLVLYILLTSLILVRWLTVPVTPGTLSPPYFRAACLRPELRAHQGPPGAEACHIRTRRAAYRLAGRPASSFLQLLSLKQFRLLRRRDTSGRPARTGRMPE